MSDAFSQLCVWRATWQLCNSTHEYTVDSHQLLLVSNVPILVQAGDSQSLEVFAIKRASRFSFLPSLSYTRTRSISVWFMVWSCHIFLWVNLCAWSAGRGREPEKQAAQEIHQPESWKTSSVKAHRYPQAQGATKIHVSQHHHPLKRHRLHYSLPSATLLLGDK